MHLYLTYIIILKVVSDAHYNQLCTFSVGTCNWSIGRRWHITNLDDGDRILMADAESREDKRNGFTDAIMSSWLRSSPICSFNIRLTFQYSIPNEHDFIEVYLIEKSRIRMTSLGQWKGTIHKNNSFEFSDPIWSPGNVTFRSTEEFRIDIEARHLANKNNNLPVWFGIDNILIENCPTVLVNTTAHIISTTEITSTSSLSWSTKTSTVEANTTTFSMPYWKLDELSDDNSSSSPGQTLLTLILYLLCALIALTLLIILFSIIIFTYRKHWCPSRSSKIDHRYPLTKNLPSNRIGIQIENIDRENQNAKSMNTTVRPCFQ